MGVGNATKGANVNMMNKQHYNTLLESLTYEKKIARLENQLQKLGTIPNPNIVAIYSICYIIQELHNVPFHLQYLLKEGKYNSRDNTLKYKDDTYKILPEKLQLVNRKPSSFEEILNLECFKL